VADMGDALRLFEPAQDGVALDGKAQRLAQLVSVKGAFDQKILRACLYRFYAKFFIRIAGQYDDVEVGKFGKQFFQRFKTIAIRQAEIEQNCCKITSLS